MSKTRGNTVDPLDWIDRFGADATRFTLARGATPGGDVAVSEEWVAGSRNFCNKLWNAARFALLNGAIAGHQLPSADVLGTADRWILSRLAEVTAEVDELYEQFEFAKICETLYHFAWDEFCDWYLELAKPVLTNTVLTGTGPAGQDEPAADATRRVLGEVLDRLLRLLHPVLPFVTEELWTALTGGESVVIARWPGATADRVACLPRLSVDSGAKAEISSLMRLVTEVRRFRSDQGLRPGQQVPAVLTGIGATPLARHEAQIRSLLRLVEPGEGFVPTGSVQAEGVIVELDTAAGLDVDAERKRLTKDLATARADIEAAERKLASPSFVERAPAEIVAKNRDRLAAAQAEVLRLTDRLAALPGGTGG
jgi:valyl-tRNA synthetase